MALGCSNNICLFKTWISYLLQKKTRVFGTSQQTFWLFLFRQALISDTQLEKLLSKMALIWVVLTYVREFKRDMQPFCFQWPYIFCFQLFSNLFLWKFFCDFTCNGEIGYSDLKHTKHRCIILHLNAWQFCVGPSTNNFYITSSIYMCTTMKIALGKKHEVRLILTWLTRNSLIPNFVPESKVALIKELYY